MKSPWNCLWNLNVQKEEFSWEQLRSRQTCPSLVNGTTLTASARTTITRKTGQQRTINIRGRGKKVIPRALMAGYNEPIGKTKTSRPYRNPEPVSTFLQVAGWRSTAWQVIVKAGRPQSVPLSRQCNYMLRSTASSVSLSRQCKHNSFFPASLPPPPPYHLHYSVTSVIV